MYEHLPPLKPLRAFEAAARHLSFSQAAEELFVTQSAISHQVRQLEQFLGKKLFIRQGKRLSLSDAGRGYLPTVQRVFASLDAASATTMGKDAGVTRMAIYSSFAMKWLIPQLPDFRRDHPDIDLRITMLTQPELDLEQLGVDCGISIGKTNPHYHYRHLQSEEWFPVCSPIIYEQLKHRTQPQGMADFPLLEGDHQREWQRLFDNLGVPLPQPPVYHYFSHWILMQQAAIEGQGIALSSEILSREDIAAGRLVRIPLNSGQEAGIFSHYYFCCARERRGDKAIMALQEWLLRSFG